MRSIATRVIIKPALSARGVRYSHSDSHSPEDTTAYPKESFGSSTWAGVLAVSALVVGFYKFAPAAGEDNFVTRTISQYSTPKEVWEKITLNHALLSQEASENQQVIWQAQQPEVHRYRYPQMIDQSVPHRQPVGSSVDLSQIVAK